MALENRQKIVLKYLDDPAVPIYKIAKSLKLPRTTAQGVLKKFKARLTNERAQGSGRKPGTHNKKLYQKVRLSFKTNPGLSNRDRAKRFNTSEGTIRNIRKKSGLKSFKAIKYPNRSDKQRFEVKKRSRRLYSEILTKHNGCLLVDDETYVKLDLKQNAGSKYYVATIRGKVLDKWKYIFVDKYAKKAMIWQGICSCGKKTRPFVTSSMMNSDIYIEECLKKRVLPFIRQHRVPVKFWPDLASCHYSKKTVEFYMSNNIDFVLKDCNPPNCPQFRPIEKFWAIVKAKLKKNAGVVENIKAMHAKWIYFSEKVMATVVQKLMGSIKRKVRNYLRTGEM